MDYLATPAQSHADPAALRTQFMARGLDHDDLDTDPIVQFQRWYQETLSAQLPEPNAMSLATVDANGQPSLRTVLLKLYDAQGFVFFTNYQSTKAQQIGGNHQVALLFPWVALARQISILGSAEQIPTHESLRYFITRGRGSRIGAWASPQSQVIRSRSLLEQKVAQIKQRFSDGEIPLPDFWGGYRVIPTSIEFWQGRDSRLHDRFRYRREAPDAPWQIERLAP
ncbi:pyridoxamine 5'-phosphate oxidase [Halochromatium salexigens]|uniref:Pyridoxine/pyridoxamine 5'-phosphate oxidase n=1 Tax=Halochromatium salexigens TaxID=49447 RepID=A0AAJ0XDT4_HALSE|nr:pyridoxamine 5'-phosphate oxidase [Halochromatium salexigens]MBK5929174.1 pyridoxamine 5'-phosphate oxidase [Halochromatium salexigens]